MNGQYFEPNIKINPFHDLDSTNYNSGTDTLFDQCNSYIMINHLNLKRVRKSQNIGDVFSEENLPIVLCCITISYNRTDTDSHVCFNVAIL